RRQRAGDLDRYASRVERHGQHRYRLLRALSVHEVLRLVVGDHAEMAVLSRRRAVGDPGPAGAPAPARAGGAGMSPRALTFALGAAIILAANAVALGGVAWNRSGEPESRVALSQRELARPPEW